MEKVKCRVCGKDTIKVPRKANQKCDDCCNICADCCCLKREVPKCNCEIENEQTVEDG